MAKWTVPVTRAQVKAAQIAVERSAKSGRFLRPGTEQLAASGKFVSVSPAGRTRGSKSTGAARKPSTTVIETTGKSSRSASSGGRRKLT